MVAAFVAAAGITAAAVFFFLIESEGLSRIHARFRSQIYNAVRWGLVIALTWLLVPATFSQENTDRPVIVIGMIALAAALMLIPVRWLVRLGGREHNWELRSARLEVAQIANRMRRDPTAISPERIDQLMARVEGLKTPGTHELCDLLLAQLEDLRAGAESWNEAGRRSIRLQQVGRQLWPGAMPAAEFDSTEATFRWRLYRLFGCLMEIGAARRTRESLDEFELLLASLEGFERPDTKAFIDDVRRTANAWLDGDLGTGPWIDGYDFGTLGPNGPGEVKALWGRDSVLWNAQLEEEDLKALDREIAVRNAARAAARPGSAIAKSSAPETSRS